jgi:crotonobetainyl-CoA:carnitine CoA-transferase CaiB-like acyl-CoA transferase
VELRPLLAARFETATVADWSARLEAAGIPFGPILDIPAAFASPEADARGMTVSMDHPRLGAITQVGIPFELARTPASIRTPPPLLGEHSDAILEELGLSAAEIAAVRADGVI